MATTGVVALLLALVLGLCGGAQAHGGGLHRWTVNPNVTKTIKTADVRPYLFNTTARCNTWTVLNTTAVSPSVYPLPFFPPTLNMTLEGTLDVISYLGNNCSENPNTALIPFLKFSVWVKSGKTWRSQAPPAGYTAFGYGFEGPCSAPGNLYRDNATLQDNRFNLAWWGAEGIIGEGMNTTDLYPGYLWGAAPGAWFVRNATDAHRMQSVVVIAQGGPTFCCSLNYQGFPAPTDLLAKGKKCSSATND